MTPTSFPWPAHVHSRLARKASFSATFAASTHATARYLQQGARHECLDPRSPLFLSPRRRRSGVQKSICRSMAEKIMKSALVAVGSDPQGLSTHGHRKSWAVRLYDASGHDLLVVRDGLGHGSVAVTQLYLPTDRARFEEMIARSDWTRSRKPVTRKIAAPVPPVLSAKPRPRRRKRRHACRGSIISRRNA